VNREAFVYAVSGVFFGLVIGWILGTQQAPSAALATATAPPAQAAAQMPPDKPAPVLDVQRASALERQANSEPSNAAVRVDLGNLYFDAERYDLAVSWYEAALKLEPKNVNASTDLGVSYYLSNQADRALQQLDYSLTIDPAHAKTLFNQGIVRAWGKQDLEGAAKSWERVIAVAPQSPEAERARVGLESIRAQHPAAAPPAGGRGAGGGLEF
jgi:tetratricopeptide (TPR) repeat protein